MSTYVALLMPDGDSGQLSPLVRAFKAGAIADAETRAAAHWGQPVARVTTSDELIAFAANQGAAACVTTTIPVGLIKPEIDSWLAASRTSGVPLLQIARRWDSLFWPHATAGFFKLKERIPSTLAKLDLAPTERSL
jgi:deoxyribodipyrimidine photo-lyase